jgi:hypothetical protein
MTPQPRDWRELAEKVSQEMDPDKLEGLIDELNRTLDRDEKASPPRRSVTPGLRRSCTISRKEPTGTTPRLGLGFKESVLVSSRRSSDDDSVTRVHR